MSDEGTQNTKYGESEADVTASSYLQPLIVKGWRQRLEKMIDRTAVE
jgi:hypothetical protein